MITKFEKYNEGIKHLLVGPTKEEVYNNIYKDRLDGFMNYLPDSPNEFFSKYDKRM